jgi:hypothetical protein
MSKNSILSQLHDLEEKSKSFNDHVLICIEADENGLPVGSAVKVKGTPFQTLGMLDLAIAKLEEARDSIHEKFQSIEDASRMMNKLPKEMVDKIRNFEEQAREALKNGDISKLEALRDQVKNDLGLSEDEGDEDGFNINDFKG